MDFLLEPCGLTAAQAVRCIGYMDAAGLVRRIIVDPHDRIWVRRGSPLGQGEWIDLFDLSGGYLGSTAAPAFPAAFLDDSTFLSISGGELGPGVDIWRVGFDDEAPGPDGT